MDLNVFVVIELQITKDGEVANIVNVYHSENEADSKYHSILAFAATSNVYRHSAAVIDEKGNTLKCESYRHVIDVSDE